MVMWWNADVGGWFSSGPLLVGQSRAHASHWRWCDARTNRRDENNARRKGVVREPVSPAARAMVMRSWDIEQDMG
jgi:hypothetical protein